MGVGLGEMDTSICMAESLCCSPETTTTLLISYTPIQNKKLNITKKNQIKLCLSKISRDRQKSEVHELQNEKHIELKISNLKWHWIKFHYIFIIGPYYINKENVY